MEPIGHLKLSESGCGSRPGLRSSSAAPTGEPSSMGQNALASLLNGSTEAPSSTTGVPEVTSERSRRSERNVTNLPSVNVRSPCSSVGKDLLNESGVEKKPRTRTDTSETSRNGNNSICSQCGASLDGTNDGAGTRDLWQFNLDMIEQHRATLLEREAELHEMRHAKNQLETRLERMERRVAMLSGNDHISMGSNECLASPATPQNLSLGKLHPGGKLQRKRRLHSRDSSGPSSRSPSPCRLSASGKSSEKRVKAPRSSHIVTNVLYDVSVPKQFPSALCRESEPVGDRGDVVAVPSWRIVEDDPKPAGSTVLRQSSASKDVENLSDETFLQRHSKHEQEEKRIKRWDMQRLRKQREHEKLLKRYEEKEVRRLNQGHEESCEVISTFLPPLDDLDCVELTDDLPVAAFGRLVPNLPRAEFSLPWFDLAKRAAEGDLRKTRSKARSRPGDS